MRPPLLPANRLLISHSSLLEDLVPFSQANPASSNYCHDEQAFAHYKEEDDAFRPHRGEVVKSVVFSQVCSFSFSQDLVALSLLSGRSCSTRSARVSISAESAMHDWTAV